MWRKAVWWSRRLSCAFTWVASENPASHRQSLESYITGDIPGHLGSLEWDGIQPEVIAPSPVLLPGVSVDFLVEETETLINKEQSLVHAILSQQELCFLTLGSRYSRVNGTGHEEFCSSELWPVSLAHLLHPAILWASAPSFLCLHPLSGSQLLRLLTPEPAAPEPSSSSTLKVLVSGFCHP